MRATLFWTLAICASACGCERKAPTPERRASANAALGAAPSGACEGARAAPLAALIDDFEDGDSELDGAAARVGVWWIATDATAGSVHPPREHVLPELSDDGRRALHFVARGFTDWGAVLGLNIRWPGPRGECPFDASRYAGLWLRAKGASSLPVSVTTPKTLPEEEGGTCRSKCFDHYTRVVQLTPEWTRYEIRWEELSQEGWGTAAPLDLEHMTGVTFDPMPPDLPLDLWLDEIGLLLRDAPEATAKPTG
jgi:hypothetical protein